MCGNQIIVLYDGEITHVNLPESIIIDFVHQKMNCDENEYLSIDDNKKYKM